MRRYSPTSPPGVSPQGTSNESSTASASFRVGGGLASRAMPCCSWLVSDRTSKALAKRSCVPPLCPLRVPLCAPLRVPIMCAAPSRPVPLGLLRCTGSAAVDVEKTSRHPLRRRSSMAYLSIPCALNSLNRYTIQERQGRPRMSLGMDCAQAIGKIIHTPLPMTFTSRRHVAGWGSVAFGLLGTQTTTKFLMFIFDVGASSSQLVHFFLIGASMLIPLAYAFLQVTDLCSLSASQHLASMANSFSWLYQCWACLRPSGRRQ